MFHRLSVDCGECEAIPGQIVSFSTYLAQTSPDVYTVSFQTGLVVLKDKGFQMYICICVGPRR
jgi:hypothetical protein